jgi:hypothetical protein
LKISEKAIGKHNPKYAITLIIVGQYYFETKDFKKSFDILVESLEILKKEWIQKKLKFQ